MGIEKLVNEDAKRPDAKGLMVDGVCGTVRVDKCSVFGLQDWEILRWWEIEINRF